MNKIINKGTKIPFAAFKNDGAVAANALQIAESTKNTPRTKEQVFEDAVNGLALEEAFIEYMNSSPRFLVTKSTDLVYDFKIVNGANEYLVDIKGRFKENARTYTQSSWERDKIQQRGLNVAYLCFNCTDGVNAVYEGFALSEDFVRSTKYTGYYIYGDQLRQTL